MLNRKNTLPFSGLASKDIAMKPLAALTLALFLTPQAFGAKVTARNILTCADNYISEWTPEGVFVQGFPVEDPDPDNINKARDIAVAGDGRVVVLNGHQPAFLSVYDPVSETWQHVSEDDWNVHNNVTTGGIGVWKNYVFVTDKQSYHPMQQGVIRFDINDLSLGGTRFARELDPQSLNIGMDGLLYVIEEGGDLGVYDPETLERIYIRSNLGERGVCANAEGEVFIISWFGNIRRYDKNGTLINQIYCCDSVENWGFTDIDISVENSIVVSTKEGAFIFLEQDLSLDTAQTFFTQNDSITYVTFINPGSVWTVY